MSTTQTVIAIVASIVGIIATIGGTAAFFRAAFDKATMDSLQRNNAVLVTENEVLTRKVESQGAEINSLTHRVDTLEKDNADLRSQRPSAVVLQDIENKSAELKGTLDEVLMIVKYVEERISGEQ